jgi:hypothetical protein
MAGEIERGGLKSRGTTSTGQGDRKRGAEVLQEGTGTVTREEIHEKSRPLPVSGIVEPMARRFDLSDPLGSLKSLLTAYSGNPIDEGLYAVADQGGATPEETTNEILGDFALSPSEEAVQRALSLRPALVTADSAMGKSELLKNYGISDEEAAAYPETGGVDIARAVDSQGERTEAAAVQKGAGISDEEAAAYPAIGGRATDLMVEANEANDQLIQAVSEREGLGVSGEEAVEYRATGGGDMSSLVKEYELRGDAPSILFGPPSATKSSMVDRLGDVAKPITNFIGEG